MELIKNIYNKLNINKILFFGFFLRIISWPWVYHGDITATYWWGKFASEFSWRGFYDWLNFGGYARPNQPMLNIYYNFIVRQIYLVFYKLFWFLNTNIPIFPSYIMQWYFIEGNQYLLKIPMIIADILIIYFCYRFTKSKKIALILVIYLPLIYNSSVWGSGDSIVNLFGLLGIYYFYKNKNIPAIIFYLSSILYKPSLLIWLPIILIILIKNKINIKNIIFSLIFIFFLIYLICLPFNPIEINPILWFFQTMINKILPGFMFHLTANAMNFWSLIFGFKLIFDNILILNLLSARNFSILICFVLYLITSSNLYKNYSKQNILLSLVNISMITFTFMTRMHERYSFPALIPLILLSFYDRRFNKYFILLSITHILNILAVWCNPNIPIIINILNNIIFIRIISLINVILTLKLIFFKKNLL